MVYINSKDFKNGVKILIDNCPMMITENISVKPGKGQAFSRVKMRNLINNKLVNKTFKSNERFSLANVSEITAHYSYFDGENYVFFDSKTFNQHTVTRTRLSNISKWIKNQCTENQDIYTLISFNEEIISVTPPKIVHLIVDKINNECHSNDTLVSGCKLAIFNSSFFFRIPLFIKLGEVVKMDTRINEYVARVK